MFTTALRAWTRSFVPLTLLAAMVGLPVTLVELENRIDLSMTLPGLLAHPLAWLLGTTVMTAASLRAIREEPFRLRPALAAVRNGGGRLLSAHAVAYGWAAAGWLVWAAFSIVLPPRGGEGVMQASAVALLVLGIVLGTRVFPLSAVVLAEPQLDAAPAARRARALTAGRRWAIFLVLLVPVLVTAVNVAWMVVGPTDVRHSVPWILGRRTAIALASGFLELLPAAAYALLRREKDPPTLAQIFE